MLQRLRQLISPTNPLRLAWHFLLEGFFAALYRFPGRELVVIGVTGTNGKTTTANLIAQILDEAGHKTALATTINFQIGKKKWENTTKKTTLGRGGLNRFLRQAVDSGCTHAVVEVSSHGLIQSRVLGVPFDAAVLTNVTPEHLDFHGSLAEYVEAKTRLFWNLAKSQKTGEKVAVLPAEDKHLAEFLRVPLEGVLTYGLKKGELKMKNLSVTNTGQKFTVTGWAKDFEIQTKLLGNFNIANILAATGCALGLGVPVRIIQTAMKKMAPLPGRLETIEAGQPFRVIVDFAHTAEALEKVIRIFRAVTPGRVWVIFGACGDRDRSLRPPRGRVLDRLADEVVITTDDPYWEDPQQTVDDLLRGIKRPEGKGLFVDLDRGKAIEYALSNAKNGDTVLICGKGCETVCPTRGRMLPWDDRKVTAKLLKRLLLKTKRRS